MITARISRALDSAILAWQIAMRPKAADLDAPLDAESRRIADEVTRWAGEYLGSPHPDLGREGAVCPFVRPSIELGRFTVSCRADAAAGGLRRLRRIVLGAASSFLARSPRSAPKSTFSSLILAFPSLPESRFAELDTVHDQLKSPLIEGFALMSTPFHPRSVRPATSNPEFHVFRSPWPLFVLRHLDVRDIRFVGHNRRGFAAYHARFAEQFARGLVSDEFGYATQFAEACARFGLGADRAPGGGTG